MLDDIEWLVTRLKAEIQAAQNDVIGKDLRFHYCSTISKDYTVLQWFDRSIVRNSVHFSLKISWSTCNMKKFDVNCCETMKFRPNLSENEILIYNSVVGNRTFLLSPNLQRNTEVHKTLTQICICGTVLIVAVSASLTNNGNLSHFDFKSHNYSVPLR